ncbi:hypothetical protein [Streptomyces sp. Ag109_G2-15]|uniref:hypothetical protein n=1 Tax=Streptomyces sp. Ag109_G2-15 TaxID=1938850 RepID=UPI000BD0977C|nr:hypothetical protein [Streptomyces sp. Ag109_G2-15]SOD81582.1 hypothetical protein SAMN06272765_0294 [Streptomyces sp. Ag109_G2-15]
MFRGTTTRTALALFTVALLALQLFAPTGTFASAHTLSEAKAKTRAGAASSVQPVCALGLSKEPVGSPHLRDRQRGSASGWAQERPLIARQAAAPHTPAASGAPHHRTTRSSRAHSPAALQVFRC